MRCYKKLKRLQKKREGIVTQNHKTVHCDVLTDIVQTVEDISVHSHKELPDGTV